VDTKLRGDIAEQAAVLYALKQGWGVLKPVGDRLPYDLALDVSGTLLRIQVKSAWFDEPSGNYVVDNRRTKTNRRVMLRDPYQLTDFDFALAYVENLDLFYIFPVEVFISYGSEIHLLKLRNGNASRDRVNTGMLGICSWSFRWFGFRLRSGCNLFQKSKVAGIAAAPFQLLP